MSGTTGHDLDHVDVRVEQDLVAIRPHGSLGQEQFQRAMELMKALQAQLGMVFLLIDLKEGERLPPAMRRAIAHLFTDAAPVAVAVHGANLEQRAGHKLLMARWPA